MALEKYLYCLFIIFLIFKLAESALSFDNSSTEIPGIYTCTGNPCTTDPCLPGVVWAVIDDNETYYHLTINGEWLWGCEETSWNGYTPEWGDFVIVVGEVSEHIDVRGYPYYNIEVESLRPRICLAEELYGEHSEETELLRCFRDNVLSKTPQGQEITRLYYKWSPVIIKAMEEDEEFKEEMKEMIDGVLLLIREEIK